MIDDDLLAEARVLTGLPTMRAVVHEALRVLVETRRRESLLELRGKVLRGTDTAATRELERLELGAVPHAVPMACAQEVLQAARDEREWKKLRAGMAPSGWRREPRSSWAAHVEAARIAFDLRRAGHTQRSAVDCFELRGVGSVRLSCGRGSS